MEPSVRGREAEAQYDVVVLYVLLWSEGGRERSPSGASKKMSLLEAFWARMEA